MKREFMRRELYELVWSEPLRQLAKKFELSDVAIAKTCRAAGIPTPGLGYWAKKEAGKPVVQTRLPERALGQSDIVVVGIERYRSAQSAEEELLREELTPPPPFEEGLPEVTARARTMVGKVQPASLGRPHPLVARLLAEDEKRRQKQLASSYPSSYDAPLFDGPFQKRRLRLINSLFHAFVRCGCKPSTRGRDASDLGVRIGDQHLGFHLKPVKARPANEYPKPVLPANEKMKLEVDWYEPPQDIRLQWQDEENATLEDQLEEIVVGLVIVGEQAFRFCVRRGYEYRVERKRELEERIRREQEEAARKERERLAKIAAERRERLISDTVAWRRASDIREYVHAQLRRYDPQTDAAVTDQAKAWALWALEEADRLDPLKRALSDPLE